MLASIEIDCTADKNVKDKKNKKEKSKKLFSLKKKYSFLKQTWNIFFFDSFIEVNVFCHQASFWKITRSLNNIMVSNHPSIIFSRFYFQLIWHDDDWCGEKHYYLFCQMFCFALGTIKNFLQIFILMLKRFVDFSDYSF